MCRAAVGADPAALTRILRGLALEDVVVEEDGRFALTAVGEQLERMAGPLRVRGEVYYHAAEGHPATMSAAPPASVHQDVSVGRGETLAVVA